MSASLAAALFAVCEIMFGIAAMMNDKHKIEENPSEHKQYDYHRNVVSGNSFSISMLKVALQKKKRVSTCYMRKLFFS